VLGQWPVLFENQLNSCLIIIIIIIIIIIGRNTHIIPLKRLITAVKQITCKYAKK